MKASVRCDALDMTGLARAEKHGKRKDWISKQRRVRDVPALTLGGDPDADGLNLADLYAAHIDGARMNKAAKKTVLHFIIHYPEEVLEDGGPVPGFAALTPEEREKRLLQQAVDFVNESHGGDAVFAARLDRDEAGRTNVDVFATPRYLKPSKSGKRQPALWVSATRFGEALARKHQDHIAERLTDAEERLDPDGNPIPITSPRAVGMALQEEFHEFFAGVNGVALEQRTLKESASKDRLRVEEWRLRKMKEEAAAALRQRDRARAAQEAADAAAAEARIAAGAALAAQADAEARAEATRRERDEARREAAAAKAEASRIETAAKGVGEAVVALAREMEAGTLVMGNDGLVYGEDVDALRPGKKFLKDAIRAAAQAQTAMNERRALLDSMKALWAEIRGAIPAVRAVLQQVGAPPDERAMAKRARREIVDTAPKVRTFIKRLAAGEGSIPPEQPRPEAAAPDFEDRRDSLGM